MNGRERFLDACACRPLDGPPIWLMRQAGRALPEYRALKEKHSFIEMVQTPELAAEVTLQPIRRFDFDAAVLFSDILVVAEALGQPYHFKESGGIEMEFAVRSAQDIDRLDLSRVTEHLTYVGNAIRLVRDSLQGRTAVLGFAGSPWTLANFMLEGGSADEFSKAKELFYSDPSLFARLMEKLTQAVIRSLKLQIAAGADAVQIFDSLACRLTSQQFGPASARWITEIVSALNGTVPVIVFARGMHDNWDQVMKTGAQVIGVDWAVSLPSVSARLPAEVAVQGNLDPFLLTTTPAIVEAETARLLREMNRRPGHIFNLGHGVPPDAKLENIETMVTTVRRRL